MKRRIIVAGAIAIILILTSTTYLYEKNYFELAGPKFAFVSVDKATQITNITFNYSDQGEITHKGTIISEYMFLYPTSSDSSLLYLDFKISKLNRPSQATQEYLNDTYISDITNGTSGAVLNATYSGFTYSYIHPSESFRMDTVVYGVKDKFVLEIILDLTISNDSLNQLIHSQIQAMQ